MAIKHNYRAMRKLKIIIFLLVLAAGAYAYFTVDWSSLGVTEVYNDTKSVATSTPAVQVDEYKDEVERVKAREDFKKQQELMAREIVLKEEKEKVLAEKAKAVAAFDAEVADLEKQLEQVRSEKVNFQ